MAEIIQRPSVEVRATMEFNEVELRALGALVGYGIDPFLRVFYEKLGEHYMKPHEAGLRTLFKAISSVVPGVLERADEARYVFTGQRKAIKPGVLEQLEQTSKAYLELAKKLEEVTSHAAEMQEERDKAQGRIAILEDRLAQAKTAEEPAPAQTQKDDHANQP